MIYFLKANYLSRFFDALKDEFLREIRIGDIGEQIREAIGSRNVFSFSLGGRMIAVSQTVVNTWFAMLIIAFLAIWLGRKFEEFPKGRQVVAEGYVELIYNLCRSQHMSDGQAQKVAPFIGTVAAFIAVSNVSAVFSLSPPSKDPVFPISLALFTIVYVIVTGIRLVGFKGFGRSLVFPNAGLLPFKILDFAIKPISLSLRLFGNVFGAFILMEFMYIVIPIIVPGILGLWFDLFDGILQGAVFAYLSAVYVGEIVEGSLPKIKGEV